MRALTTIIFILNILNGYSQVLENQDMSIDTLYYPGYTDGIYKSKSDFINRTPSSKSEIYPVKLYVVERITDSLFEHNIYFFSEEKLSKIRNVFAISYKGQLYFQIKAILKNRNKADRAQSNSRHQSFVRVINGGKNYLYTEAELVNQWAAGTTVNFGFVGGQIYKDLIKGKGVVWDYKNQEFNIFKSCKDYNEFIENILPDAMQECDEHQPDNFKVREAIEKIK